NAHHEKPSRKRAESRQREVRVFLCFPRSSPAPRQAYYINGSVGANAVPVLEKACRHAARKGLALVVVTAAALGWSCVQAMLGPATTVPCCGLARPAPATER